MRYFLIMNPLSKGGKSKLYFDKIFRKLDAQGIRYDFEITASPDKAYELSQSANKQGYEVIVAVGGDGTINKVLNGFYDSEGIRISNSRFGVLYTGTSPDFCKSYGIPIDVDAGLKTLINNKSKEIQIGKIDFSIDNNGHIATQYFGCCVNIGLGAQVARRSNTGVRKYFGDFSGTFMALLRTLITYEPCDIIILANGNKKTFKKVYNISIGKTYFIASGIKVKNDLIDGDSKFYSLLFQNIKLSNIVKLLKLIYRGEQFTNSEVVNFEYGKSFEIEGSNQKTEVEVKVEVEFDGDPVGFLPCKIEMAEGALEIICEL